SVQTAHSDEFSNRPLFLLDVLEQHAVIDEGESPRSEMLCLCIAAYEPRSRIVTISANRFRNAIWTDIDACSPYRWMQRADGSQNDSRPAANGKHFHARPDVMSHVPLNPSVRIDLCLEPRGLTRVVHDVINRCGLDHCFLCFLSPRTSFVWCVSRIEPVISRRIHLRGDRTGAVRL